MKLTNKMIDVLTEQLLKQILNSKEMSQKKVEIQNSLESSVTKDLLAEDTKLRKLEKTYDDLEKQLSEIRKEKDAIWNEVRAQRNVLNRKINEDLGENTVQINSGYNSNTVPTITSIIDREVEKRYALVLPTRNDVEAAVILSTIPGNDQTEVYASVLKMFNINIEDKK